MYVMNTGIIDSLFNNIMSSSPSSRSISIPLLQPSEHSSDLEEVIILSDTPAQPMVPQVLSEEGVNEQVVELAHPRYLNDDDQEQRRKQDKIQNALEMLKSIEQKEKEEASLKRQLIAKKTTKEETRKLEQQIKKQFPAYTHLTVTALTRVKNKMQSFDRLCKMEETHKDLKNFRKVRQQNRNKLTQALMLAIEELRQKVKTEEYCSREIDLIQEEVNTLIESYDIATKIQIGFFKLLVKKFGQLQNYQNQLSIILKQFKDKNNIQFRRDILNNNIDLEYLAKAQEQDLKCQKTKEEELAELQSYIRQNEKQTKQQREYEEQADLEKINFMNHIRSSEAMDIEMNKPEVVQIMQRNNDDLIVKCKKTYKRCDQKMKNLTYQRQTRILNLLEENEHNNFFMDLCLRYKMS